MMTSMKKFAVASTVAMTMMGASAASAATFDFVAMADDAADANYIGGTELNWQDTVFAAGLTIDGITLIGSGSNGDGTFADAFFDKGDAGLGVCSTVDVQAGSGCATGIGTNTADDNVSDAAGDETLTLTFSEVVDITGITFYEKHSELLTGSMGLGGGTLTLVDGVITAGAELLLGQSVFDFTYTGDEFYMANATAVAAVPLPAGLALLLSGLGAFGVMGRRRKATTA